MSRTNSKSHTGPNDLILHRALGELFTQGSNHRQM